VQDYGVEPSFEVFRHVISGVKNSPEIDYDQMREEFGDSILDYRRIKEFLGVKDE
jgi:hypothetical protein